jgi:hypothetical protein
MTDARRLIDVATAACRVGAALLCGNFSEALDLIMSAGATEADSEQVSCACGSVRSGKMHR